MRGDGRIIRRGARKHFSCEPLPEFEGGVPRFFNLLRDNAVILWIYNHRDALMVFRRAPQHGRTADINVLNGFGERDVGPGDGLLEWIKIYDHQVDGLNAMGTRGSLMAFVTPHKQQRAMDLRVQSFDAPIEHFRKSGV